MSVIKGVTTHYCNMHVNMLQEELNAMASANYDVELLHLAEAHDELSKTGIAQGISDLNLTLGLCMPLNSRKF